MRARSICVAVAVLLISVCASLPTRARAPGHSADATELRRLTPLHVQGPHLVGADGREVRLRGINLGGWLVTENWMCGIVDSSDTPQTGDGRGGAGRFTDETLEARFGPQEAKTLSDAWRDHWIMSEDIDRIRDAGFNLIRVPISYRTLQRSDGRWLLNSQGQIDFSRMDWIVAEAARRGIYTIFDLHVWPEQRYSYEKIGRPEGLQIRRAMSRLWTAIALHYRGNGAVAGFDLINELPGAWGVQQVLSHAVRSGDPDRVQIVEGFSLSEFLKLHRAGAFPNSVYSEHLYATGPLTTETLSTRLRLDAQSPVPVYVGEFLAQDFPAAARVLDRAGVAWSSWTYKTVDMGDWGFFDYDPSLKVDVQHDSFSTILAKWTSGLKVGRTSAAWPNAHIMRTGAGVRA